MSQMTVTSFVKNLTSMLAFFYKAGFICKGSPLQVAACANSVQKLGGILIARPASLHGLPADMDRHGLERLTLLHSFTLRGD